MKRYTKFETQDRWPKVPFSPDDTLPALPVLLKWGGLWAAFVIVCCLFLAIA